MSRGPRSALVANTILRKKADACVPYVNMYSAETVGTALMRTGVPGMSHFCLTSTFGRLYVTLTEDNRIAYQHHESWGSVMALAGYAASAINRMKM